MIRMREELGRQLQEINGEKMNGSENGGDLSDYFYD